MSDKKNPIIKYNDLGNKELAHGNAQEACRLFEMALNKQEDEITAWMGLGYSLEILGDFHKSALAFKTVISIDSKSFQGLHGLGRCYIRTDQPELSIETLGKAINLNPSSASAWCDLGLAEMTIENFSAAEKSLNQAISLDPKFSFAMHHLGDCYKKQNNLEKAIYFLKKALNINPNLSSTIASLASALSDMNQSLEAHIVLDKYLKMHPEDVECNQNKALILLRDGKLIEGLKQYEWRFYPTAQSVPVRPITKPRWRGEKLKGKSIFIWLEQGIGDEVLSLRLIEYYLEQCDNCIVECDERLVPLVSRAYPEITVCKRTNPPDQIFKSSDFSCPVWSGAIHLSKYLKHFQNANFKTSYLSAEIKDTNLFKKKYRKLAGKRAIVGLSWASGGKAGKIKTPPLEEWKNLLSRKDIFFVSVQYSPAQEDIDFLEKISGNTIFLDKNVNATKDLDLLASQLSALDATVSVSNSTAHLCGALGLPIANVIPFGRGGFWYWFREKDKSPWYPSMKIFRQEQSNDWESAINKSIEWVDHFVI